MEQLWFQGAAASRWFLPQLLHRTSASPSPLLLPPCQFLAGLGNKSGALLLPRAESICFLGNSYFEDVRRELARVVLEPLGGEGLSLREAALEPGEK